MQTSWRRVWSVVGGSMQCSSCCVVGLSSRKWPCSRTPLNPCPHSWRAFRRIRQWPLITQRWEIAVNFGNCSTIKSGSWRLSILKWNDDISWTQSSTWRSWDAFDWSVVETCSCPTKFCPPVMTRSCCGLHWKACSTWESSTIATSPTHFSIVSPCSQRRRVSRPWSVWSAVPRSLSGRFSNQRRAPPRPTASPPSWRTPPGHFRSNCPRSPPPPLSEGCPLPRKRNHGRNIYDLFTYSRVLDSDSQSHARHPWPFGSSNSHLTTPYRLNLFSVVLVVVPEYFCSHASVLHSCRHPVVYIVGVVVDRSLAREMDG